MSSIFLKNELYWKAKPAPPPAPPPPPPKSFLSSFKLPFKKKTKRSISMPENMNVITKQGRKNHINIFARFGVDPPYSLGQNSSIPVNASYLIENSFSINNV